MFGDDLTRHHHVGWRTEAQRATGTIDLGGAVPVGVVALAEEISRGQVVSRYMVEGFDGTAWHPLSHGMTIGYRKLDRFPTKTVRQVRVTVDAAFAAPDHLRVALYTGS
jgi:alpha-L-fucosidase